MSRPGDNEPFPDRGFDESQRPSWPLDPDRLLARERWVWYEQLWSDVCALRDRYRLPVRAGWWENQLQVEALAALAAWVERYDSGQWDDPPGKLALLYELDGVAGLLRDGDAPFVPRRDRPAFTAHLPDLAGARSRTRE